MRGAIPASCQPGEIALELAFESIEIRKVCEKGAFAEEKHGKEFSINLQARLSDLRAASSISDLVAGKPEILASDELLIEIIKDFRIKLVSNHVKQPRDSFGRIDWHKVSRVRITMIGN